MPYFFDGRLHVTPDVMSRVDDSAMANTNPNVGNVLAIIGRSSGGQPNTALTFGSADEAKAALVSGDLVDAITRAFDPSVETVGPATIVGIRVNPAIQSTLVLVNSVPATVINLASTDYGQRTTQIKVKIEAGSVKGLKLTTAFGDSLYTQDNVYRDAFKVRYTGAQATGRMAVTNTAVTLEAPTGTVLATIDLNAFPTVQQLVDRINATVGFTASVADGNGLKASLNGLDTVAATDVKTAEYTAPANLQAVVDWFNSSSEGFITATRAAGAGTVPAVIPFTYLTGGIDGVVTNTEWTNALTVLQSSDVQWVVPLSSDPSIHAMVDAHTAYMSKVARLERRAICGTPSGTTDAAAVVLAKAVASDRTSLTHLGGYDYDATGALVFYEPFIVAAMLAGAFSGLNPGTPLTNKSLKLRGIERKLRNPTDTDALIQGGVLCVESTADGYRVVKSISTWLTNSNYNRVEQSVGVAIDYTSRAVREVLAKYKGRGGDPVQLSLAASDVDTVLRQLSKPQPSGLGVLVGDDANPPFKNITAKLVGDVMAISFQCSPVIPINFIPVTIYAQPYSGSVSI